MAQRASLHIEHMLWAALLMPAVARGQVITCSTSAVERKVRAEGLTELLGDIEAQCTLSRPGSAGAYLTSDVTLCMNTSLTNVRGFRADPDITDAVLIVNENHAPPADSSTLGGPQGNVPVPQYGKGFSVNDRCDPGEALSPLRAPNALKWSGVRIPVPGGDAGNGRRFPDPVTLRVTNMRVAANILAVGTSEAPTLILAKAFTITDSTGVPGLDPVLALAEVDRGFSTSIRSASGAGVARGMQCLSQNITGGLVTGSPSFFVHVQEDLPDTLRPLGLPTTLFRTSSGEDGYPTPGVGANGGGATQGTRVAISFLNVLAGARIALPKRVTAGRLVLQLTATDFGFGPFAPVPGDGLQELDVTNGFALASYEVTAADPATIESADVPVTVGYIANPAGNSPALGTMVMYASLGPTSTIATFSAAAPRPRFADTSTAYNAFTIDRCPDPGALAISSLVPNSATAGDPPFAITIKGSGFTADSIVFFDNVPAFAIFVNSTELTVPVSAIPEDLDARVINVRVLNLTGDFSNAVPFTLKAKISPVIQVRAVVDGAGSPSALAPGAIATILGDGLAAGAVEAKQVPVPRQIDGVRVRMSGVDAPIFLVSANRISFQVPFETPLGPAVPVVVVREGLGSSPAVSVQVAEFAPVVYSAAAGDPYIIHGDFQLVSASRPAEAGEVVTVFGSGIGGLTDPPATGAAASGSPPSVSRIPCTITIGGIDAEVLFAGLAPDNVGLAQWDVRVPPSLPVGQVPLIIRFGDSASKPVLLSVR